MIKSNLVKKIGYKTLSVLCPNGIPVTVNGMRLKLPVPYFRLFPANYEEENFHFITSRVQPGAVVLDIGAHIGLTAIAFAKRVGEKGRVFSFEPTPQSFATLKETTRINGVQNIVRPQQMPVAETSGRTKFYISKNAVDVANTLTPWEEGKDVFPIEVNSTSIDDFVVKENLSRVDFVKIDAEGVELGVLKGARKTFRRFRPVSILALHPAAISANGDTLETIYDFVTQIGYRAEYNGSVIDRERFCAQQGLFDVHLFPSAQ